MANVIWISPPSRLQRTIRWKQNRRRMRLRSPSPQGRNPSPKSRTSGGKNFRQSRSRPHLPLHPRPQARSPYPFLREIVWFPYPAVRHRSLRRFPAHPPQLSPLIPSGSPICCPPQRTLFDGDRQPRSSLTLPLTTRRDGQQRRRIARIGGRCVRCQEEEGKRGLFAMR